MLGKTVSHYEVTGSLGAGAMGEVYAARDTLLGRSVAIKVLHGATGASEETRRRFLQEARAASALNHPGIVTIHDVVCERDVDCIVMELVRGETLGERVSRGPVPVEEALTIIDRIADALAAAHGRGIVHRDLKPANVMLTQGGGLKVLDFGLAKFLPTFDMDTNAPPLMRTESGVVMGTPLYMSPEQVKGKPLDGRSDVFSLGSMALEMLSGSHPFEGDSAVSTMHRIAYEPLDESVLQRVPETMRGLVRRMLAKDKEERFQGAEEVRLAVAEIRAGRAVTVSLPAPEPPARASKARPVAVAAAAVLAVTIGIAASQLWRTSTGPPAPRQAVAQTFTPPRTAHHHIQRGNALLSTYWRKRYYLRAAEEFQRAIALEPDHAGAHAGLAFAHLFRHLDSGDRTWLDLALKNARHAVELDPQLASAHVALGAAELAAGNVAAARKELEQTLLTDPGNAAAHRWLGAVAAREEDPKTAETELRKALALQPKDPDLHNALGWFLYTAARYDDAAAAFRQVIRLAPDYIAAYRNLGAVLHMRGDYAGAARAIQQSLESEPDPTGYSNLGTLYFFQGLYPQAVSAFEKAVQLGANDHVVWANLGDAYRWTPGNQDRARDSFATALRLLEDDLRRDPGDATLQSRKALYLAKKGDARNARLTADPLMSGGEKDPQTLYRLALAFELTGARDRSLTALAQAIRNGYSTEELKADPELASLRRDAQYQRMMTTVR